MEGSGLGVAVVSGCVRTRGRRKGILCEENQDLRLKEGNADDADAGMGYWGLVLVPSAMPRMAMQMLGYAGPPGAYACRRGRGSVRGGQRRRRGDDSCVREEKAVSEGKRQG